MFCVIIKVNGYLGDDTMVIGPYENKQEAREAQKAVKSIITTGVNVENISTEVKEMVKL